MKKLWIGILVGFALSFATMGYASNVVETVLYPVKLYLNGEEQTLGGEYEILNYNGHAYVPLRFLAEQLDGKVTFDEAGPSINISLHSLGSIPMKGYTEEEAVKNGDIVRYKGVYQNLDKLEQFRQSVLAKQSDWLRVTISTIEGDPLIFELWYDGRRIWFLKDYSRDAFGYPSRTIDVCTRFELEDGKYWVTGCEKTESTAFPSLMPKSMAGTVGRMEG